MMRSCIGRHVEARVAHGHDVGLNRRVRRRRRDAGGHEALVEVALRRSGVSGGGSGSSSTNASSTSTSTTTTTTTTSRDPKCTLAELELSPPVARIIAPRLRIGWYDCRDGGGGDGLGFSPATVKHRPEDF